MFRISVMGFLWRAVAFFKRLCFRAEWDSLVNNFMLSHIFHHLSDLSITASSRLCHVLSGGSPGKSLDDILLRYRTFWPVIPMTKLLPLNPIAYRGHHIRKSQPQTLIAQERLMNINNTEKWKATGAVMKYQLLATRHALGVVGLRS